MPQGGLKIDRRRSRILQELNSEGQVWTAELAEKLGTTEVTVRNDLKALEQEGFLERIKGGAVKNAGSAMADFRRRSLEMADEKRRIAAALAARIPNNATLMINSGSTTCYVAEALRHHRNLRIITNSLDVAGALRGALTIHVILLGGEMNSQYGFTGGGGAHEQIKNYWADYCILSMDGVSPERGITSYYSEEVLINQTMISRSDKTLVVADRRKLGRESFSFVAPFSAVDLLITDSGAEADLVRRCAEAGVETVTA